MQLAIILSFEYITLQEMAIYKGKKVKPVKEVVRKPPPPSESEEEDDDDEEEDDDDEEDDE